MTEDTQPVLSTGKLILSVVFAMIVGFGLTMLVILPAEEGIDPTGFGKVSGLDKLASQTVPTEEVVQKVEEETVAENTEVFYIAIDPQTTKPKVDEFGDSLPAVDGANLRRHDAVYKSETIEIQIGVDAQVEYKAIMERGEVLLYSWQADGELYYDFHAHQEAGNPGFWTRYSEGEALNDQGSIVAPYSGEHGWYWLNIAGKPVSVKLSVSGYYNELKQIDLNK